MITAVMGTKERREREREEVRTKIMDAARELFVRDGYESVSMRKIAEAIEYSPTAIYIHFADKAELMQQLCQHDFQSLAHVFHDLAQIHDPIERIRQTGHTYIRFAAKHPNHYRFMFMTPHAEVQGECEIKAAYEADQSKNDPNENSYLFLLLACEQAIEEARLRKELNDPQLVAQTFWAAVHGVASLEVTFRNDPWIQMATLETRAATMVDGIIRGLVRTAEEAGEEAKP
jgi:AcrR family transcriptional regulator